MKLALADLPAPFLAEPRVVACGNGERWHDFARVLAEAGIPDGGPASGDLAAALALVSGLRASRRRRLDAVLDAMPDGSFPSSLRKPIGPDGKLLLTEGRIALARSNDRRPAQMVVGFSKFATALADPFSVIRLPAGGPFDAEAALVAVVGRHCPRATEAGAARAIVGYTLMCEVTDRGMFDEEARTNNSLFAKNRLGLSPFGPAIRVMGAKELTPATEVTLTVNGALRQRFAVGDFAHAPVAAVKAWSRCVLEPGDAVGLGAAICEPSAANMVDSPVAIAAGDTVEVACAPIGVLRARFVA